MSTGVGLLSGGLDSILAICVLREQNIRIEAVAFITPFFGPGNAQKAVQMLNVPLHVVDIPDVHLQMLKKPTGGGLVDNPPRILPEGVAVCFHGGSWPVPHIFQLIQRVGGVADEEMARVFNLGLGMLLVLAPDQVEQVLTLQGDHARAVGEIAGRGDGPAVNFKSNY